MPQINEKVKNYPILLVHGPAGAGKTRVASTVSAHYNVRPPAERKPMIVLGDMLWLQFDRTGLDTLHGLGMDPHFYDLSVPPTAENLAAWITGVKRIIAEAGEMIRKQNIKFLVLDTLSGLADLLTTAFLLRTVSADPKAKQDTQGAYRNANIFVFDILNAVRALPVMQIWLCHSKSAFIDEAAKTAEAQNARKEAAKPGKFDVDLALTPQVADAIRKIPSFTFGITVETSLEGMKHKLILSPEDQSFYVKNRFADRMPQTATPDLRPIWALAESLLFQAGDTFENNQ